MSDNAYKKIEEVQVGDEVMSFDFAQNKQIPSKVYEMSVHDVGEIYDINNGAVQVTSQHPFWVKKSYGVVGWGSINPTLTYYEMDIGKVYKIVPGDYIYTTRGNWQRVNSVELIDEATKVYNLKSVGMRTFYVNDFLVHNKASGEPYDSGGGGGMY
jgi:hypothetical protein